MHHTYWTRHPHNVQKALPIFQLMSKSFYTTNTRVYFSDRVGPSTVELVVDVFAGKWVNVFMDDVACVQQSLVFNSLYMDEVKCLKKEHGIRSLWHPLYIILTKFPIHSEIISMCCASHSYAVHLILGSYPDLDDDLWGVGKLSKMLIQTMDCMVNCG